ncbi:MAG: M1 family metallopeptidase [Promethearchaeota archaeon]
MKRNRYYTLIIMLSFTMLLSLNHATQQRSITSSIISEEEQPFLTVFDQSNYEEFSSGNFSGLNFSNYTLSVKLDEENSLVRGNLTADFYNGDPISFSSIPFHLYPSGMAYESRQGDIEILNVTTISVPKCELMHTVLQDEQLMWINLSTPLEPGEYTSFCISFITTLPDGGIDRANSHGYDGNQTRIYKFASAYPIPCVYDEFDGWNTDPYLQIGDPFYFDMANYDFFIEVPVGMVVAATGEMLERTTDGVTVQYHYNPLLPVREMTFSASRYFETETTLCRGVNVSTYFLPKSESLWSQYATEDNALQVAVDALTLFNDTFGAYPYPTLNIVEEHTWYGGMEYPCQVYISEAIPELINNYQRYSWYLEKVIVHEICHQWWYQLVGNDEIDYGFLDEGLVCWSTDYFGQIKSPPGYPSYWEKLRYYYFYNERPSKINQSLYEYIESSTDWIYACYYKAPVIFEKLRVTIGNDDFLSGLNNFFRQYYFKIARLSDLQRSFEEVTGSSLDWFFLPWFNNPFLPNYNFQSVEYNSSGMTATIIIEDLNEIISSNSSEYNTYSYSQQVPIYIYDSNNQVIYSEVVWINGTTTLMIPVTRQPAKVSLILTDDVLAQLYTYDVDSLDAFFTYPTGFNIAAIFIICLVAAGIIGIGYLILKRRKLRDNGI